MEHDSGIVYIAQTFGVVVHGEEADRNKRERVNNHKQHPPSTIEPWPGPTVSLRKVLVELFKHAAS